MSRAAGLILAVAGAASAQLSLEGIKCGQIKCQLGQYCSSETDRCAPCDDICNDTIKHNYDPGLCVKECQEYIHDLRYLSKSEGSMNGDFRSVQIQALAALVISCLALGVLLLILLLKYIRYFRNNKGKFTWKYVTQKLQSSKNRVKQYPTDLTHHNPHAEMAKPTKHELKLEIRDPQPPKRQTNQPLNVRDLDNRTSHTEKSIGATTPKTTTTSLSNRHPAEDTTLDYSYDNMGMNVTPPPVQASASHNF